MEADNRTKPLALASPWQPCSEILAHYIEQITIPSLSGLCSLPFAAMQRQEECYRTCLILSKMIVPFTFRRMSSLYRARTAAKRWPFWGCRCAFLRRIQPSVKHVRLMIFCNWISQKAGDKVPHIPLILPISTAGLKHALPRKWIWRKRMVDDRRRRLVWTALQGWRAAKGVPALDFQQERWGLIYMWDPFRNLSSYTVK